MADYTYDANNQRIKKVVTGATTRFYFGVSEYSGGVLEKILLSVAGAPVEYQGATVMRWYYLHYKGTGRVVTDAASAVVATKDYYPFGEEVGTTPNNEHKAPGYNRDDEGGPWFAE